VLEGLNVTEMCGWRMKDTTKEFIEYGAAREVQDELVTVEFRLVCRRKEGRPASLEMVC
jgi:hypothetical protein